MSVQEVKSEIIKFLKSDVSLVLAIRGAWGVGKTHLWDEVIKHEEGGRIKNYSYISLFGVNSIKDVKFSIWENMENLNSTSDEKDEWLGNKLLELRKKAGGFLPDKFKGINLPLKDIAFNSVKESIICIDDLERHGNGIEIEDVFGLASFLKEKKSCKVVFLLNEDMLEKEKGKFEGYSEKVIDISITLQPDASESLSLIFNKSDKETYPVLEDFCTRLNITNIRILSKIKHFLNLIISEVDTKEIKEETRVELVFLIVLLVYCHFDRSKPEVVPSLQKLRDELPEFFFKTMQERPDNVRGMFDFLEAYGFSWFQYQNFELVREIIDSIFSGYVVRNRFLEILRSRNEFYTQNSDSNNYQKVWDEIYHADFNCETELFIEKLETSFKNAAYCLSLNQLISVVWILKSLDRGDLAEDLIDYFIKENSESPQKLSLEEYGFPVDDETIREKLNEFSTTEIVCDELSELIKIMPISEGMLGLTEINCLAQFTSKDFIEAIKSTKNDKDLFKKLRVLVRDLKPNQDIDDPKKLVFSELVDALRKIGDESLLNKIRIDVLLKEVNGY